MIGKRIYISCPMSISLSYLMEVETFLITKNLLPLKWDRNTQYGLREKDAIMYGEGIVVILPENSFKLSFNKIPTGTESEIRLAMKYGKPIYLAYTSNEGLGLYETIIEDNIIKGIGGTRNKMFDAYNRGELIKSKESHRFTHIDLLDKPQVITNPCAEIPINLPKTCTLKKTFIYDKRILLLI